MTSGFVIVSESRVSILVNIAFSCHPYAISWIIFMHFLIKKKQFMKKWLSTDQSPKAILFETS